MQIKETREIWKKQMEMQKKRGGRCRKKMQKTGGEGNTKKGDAGIKAEGDADKEKRDAESKKTSRATMSKIRLS